MVKRLRRRPLTAETGVRFPYELLTDLLKNRTAQPEKAPEINDFGVFFVVTISVHATKNQTVTADLTPEVSPANQVCPLFQLQFC